MLLQRNALLHDLMCVHKPYESPAGSCSSYTGSRKCYCNATLCSTTKLCSTRTQAWHASRSSSPRVAWGVIQHKMCAQTHARIYQIQFSDRLRQPQPEPPPTCATTKMIVRFHLPPAKTKMHDPKVTPTRCAPTIFRYPTLIIVPEYV